jgi:UDP-glucose 4-epimerase
VGAAPASPYAASKLAAESYALAYARSFGLDVLPLRFFNVFGPRQDPSHAYAAVIPAFISAALAGRPLTILGDGQQTRDFIFVGSVARILTAAVVRRVASAEPVNVAAGTRISLLHLADVLGELVGHPLSIEHESARVGDVRHSQADVSRLRELFGEDATASLRSGLAQTLAWFRTADSGRAVA